MITDGSVTPHCCILLHQVLGPNGLLHGKTRILVTHRLSYVKRADEIVVLGDGQIIEIGRYDDLMKKCGVFAKFAGEYSSKSKEEEEDSGIDDVSSLENICAIQISPTS
ncbi:hypothetical protein ANCCAN_21498 [Ancylostoma caninum]|uniref:ABC transporter domain-containing protein n=1 Tax=Ancylostoma caninum TaxID=29170 RepID=A0A368FKM0_ANCCA|nr:hypothetical protein ANCCAN_21498 [Ancylostoma caninum]